MWHTWSPVDADRTELTLWRGEGYRVQDIEGREYIDASALNSTCGYAHPDVIEAITTQLGRLHHVDVSLGSHEPVGLLAERLASYLPQDMAHTLFVNSGSEGFEAALMIAASYWEHIGRPRQRVVAFSAGYQGSTLVSRGLSTLPRVAHPLASPVPLSLVDLPGTPRQVRQPETTPVLLDAFARALEGDGSDPAMAVVVEPFLNVGGGVLLPPGFLRGLRELCDRHGVLLILDEVFTGYARTGRMFAYQWEQAEPDILVTSKGLSGGYVPIASVSVRDRIYESFVHEPVIGGLRYGHTTSGHPVASAAALATLDVIEREGLVKRAQVFGERLLERLGPLAGSGEVLDVRGLGLITVLETSSTEAATGIVARAREKGLILRRQGAHGQSVLIVPPLIVDEEGLTAIMDLTEQAVAAG
ncbi:aspartate aminotransferase family protein [Streptomyces sp. NPDC058459]|uniref:aminotransferase family protein n=1 Tax=Streptomyces sp. NPDC058459 TaxID=3346508 RepID=UPI0036576ABC